LKENKESDEIFRNISFIKMESSKSINYSTNMCPSDQVTNYYDTPYVVEGGGWEGGVLTSDLAHGKTQSGS